MSFLVACFVLPAAASTKATHSEKLTQYVDPFIGTAAHGHTFPGATLPFGMIQLSPDNGTAGWDWCSGYNYNDNQIAGFSHTHLSGTGIGDLADISVMPTNKPILAENFKEKDSFQSFYRSTFNHNNEIARPGYYQVMLQDDHINAELTTTLRVGFHRYTFSNPKNKAIIFDLGFHINWDIPTETCIQIKSKTLIVGYRFSKGWAPNQKVYFAALFSKPFSKYQPFFAETNGDESKGTYTKGVFSFDEHTGKQIMVKVAISSASIDGALKELSTDSNGWNFDQVVAKADDTWNSQLSKFAVETPDKDQKTIFYTALYHSLIAPNTYSDINGEYKGYKNTVKKTDGYTKYTVLSLWDTFRALNPLLTISNPQMVNDLIKSMLDQYNETGLLPVWELEGNETNCMIGYHSIPIITDAIIKGIGDFDREKAYKAMLASATSDKNGINYFREIGYIPADKVTESASRCLEYCYDDWCIAQAAKFLGKKDDYKTYLALSQNYKNQFDPSVGFMRGRNYDGSWVSPFNPKYSKHETGVFTEGNAWQWTWFVPHDILGLANLMGGKEQMINKLDQLFTESSEILGEDSSPDISGLIGQYAQGNEPVHHVAYMYNLLGAPWKTQERIDNIMKTLYTSKPDGLCGNDDCGQMSAWYVFNAMGLYPANSVTGNYELGSPRFTKTEILASTGKIFKIIAPEASKENIYIQAVTLNGKPLKRTYITHKEILAGGTLNITMGPSPLK